MPSQNTLSPLPEQQPLSPMEERFIKFGLESLSKEEIIELVLNLQCPIKDYKKLARQALRKYKTLREFLTAPLQELEQIPGMTPHHVLCIKLMQEVAREFLKEKIIEQPIYKSAQEVFDYLYHSMRDLKKEVFKVIYLNSQNQIIDITDLFEGTITSSSISPRQIIESAIKHNAASLIFVHNHPSGNPEPSANDREITRDLVYAASIMQIKVLDHIILGNNRYFSFAGEGLIDEYKMGFLNIKIRYRAEAKPSRYRAKVSDPELPWHL